MSYQATLQILADPTRHALVEMLRNGPQPVGRLAAGLPVSRPAISKHLRLMKEAGVVKMTEDGTKNLYELNLESLRELQRYLEGFWGTSLGRLKEAAETSYRAAKKQDSDNATREEKR
jgi:DNA-binding transcriptional ArsR family regulator